MNTVPIKIFCDDGSAIEVTHFPGGVVRLTVSDPQFPAEAQIASLSADERNSLGRALLCVRFGDEVLAGPPPSMTVERFNELLNGPLSHPLPMFAISRLVGALVTVMETGGWQAAQALEHYCEMRERRDAGYEGGGQ